MTPLLVLSLALAAPVPKAPEKAEAKYDGVWVLTARETNGRLMKTSDTLKETYTLVIVGNDYVFRNHAGTIKFDKAKKTFDVAVTGGLYKGENSGGVFERDGTTLKIAMPSIPRTATARPTELATGPGTSHYLYTFELDKDASEKAAEKLKAKTAALPAGRVNPFNPVAPVAPLPALPVAPARPNPAAQLQEALERIEKLEKRVQELEKEKSKGKDEKKDDKK
jgi:uncharacterized protein (TIGR03067 family)